MKKYRLGDGKAVKPSFVVIVSKLKKHKKNFKKHKFLKNKYQKLEAGETKYVSCLSVCLFIKIYKILL